MLWARSGNRCAFPNCAQLLVEDTDSASGGVVIGEEAHIVARELDGPRGSEAGQHPIDSYLNHILLCPTHHRVVDEHPETFTVAALQTMRRDHEHRIRCQMYAESAPIEIPVADFHGLGLGKPMTAWQLRSAIVIVYSFGSPPMRQANGHLIGSGFQFLESTGLSAARTLLVSSEAQPDIEFWIERDALHVLQQTFDPDADRFAPLAEHTFDGTHSPIRHSISFLLKTAPASADALDDIARELQSIRPGNYGRAEILLYQLRNLGVRQPVKALKILAELKKEPWYDGAIAESGSDVERDLQLAQTFEAAV